MCHTVSKKLATEYNIRLTYLIPKITTSAESHDDRDRSGILVNGFQSHHIRMRHELQSTFAIRKGLGLDVQHANHAVVDIPASSLPGEIEVRTIKCNYLEAGVQTE